MGINKADVAELVDARDLKSLDGNVVWVRVPPPAPRFAVRATRGAATPEPKGEACPAWLERKQKRRRTRFGHRPIQCALGHGSSRHQRLRPPQPARTRRRRHRNDTRSET